MKARRTVVTVWVGGGEDSGGAESGRSDLRSILKAGLIASAAEIDISWKTKGETEKGENEWKGERGEGEREEEEG